MESERAAREAALAAEIRGRAALRLGVAPEAIGDDQPLTALGLDSLAAVELEQEIASALGVAIAAADLLDGIGVRRLAAAALAGAAAADPLGAAGGDLGEQPLSYGQRALWFLQRLAPASAAYHIAAAFDVRGPLDEAALGATFQALADRHPALRTTFHDQAADGSPGPVARVHAAMAVDFSAADAGGAGDEEVLASLWREARRPFALDRGPLLRVALRRRAADDCAMVFAVHHLVADFASLATLFAELAALYSGAAPASLPVPAVRYGDYVRWQAARLDGALGEALWAFWRAALAPPPPPLDLATDRPRPPVGTDHGGIATLALEPRLLARVEEVARASGATLFQTLLAAWVALLARTSGRRDLAVGCPAAGRGAPELAGLVGYLVNPVVVRAMPDDFAGASFASFLARLHRRVLDAFAHQDFPFALLAERLQPERNASRPPIFQVLFTLQPARPGAAGLAAAALGIAGPPVALGQLALAPRAERDRPAQLDLALQAACLDGGIAAALSFRRDLFDDTTAARLLGHWGTLLAAAAADPFRPLDELPLLTPAERQQTIREWNATAAPLPELTLHGLIEAQVDRSPDAVAVSMGERALTFGMLDRRADRLARHLRRRGLTPETPVGVYAERSPEMVVALLGVLKAGCAYLPLDPAPGYPAGRLAAMLSDSRAPLVVTDLAEERLRPALAGYRGGLLRLDAGGLWPAGEPALPRPRTDAQGAAYLIYTSGSTGRPKGVVVRHRGVVNFLGSMAQAPGLAAGDVLVAVTTLSFDIAGLELYLPLSVGARVVLAGRETAADGARLLALLAACGATVMQATPATWRLLVAAGWRGEPRLRALCGGEALPADLARELVARAAEVWNLYGPTETTIWSAAARLEGAAGGAVPIGAPIANTAIYVVGRDREPLPQGVPGELLIGGLGLARGYFEDPARTAERFIPDPFGASGGRLYRTGDLARRRGDGALECLGRLDDQVKVRGVRIELGEVEAALAAAPEVAQAVAAARPDPAGGERLVAYVVPAEDAALDLAALRRALAARLPEAFLPSLFVTLASLPLTPNGKVDRRALPAPEGARPEAAGAYEAPASRLERTVAAIWRRVLKLPQVGRHDNFFDLGGHSLLLAQAHAELERELGRELAMVELFRHPTVHLLARHLAEEVGDAAISDASTRRPRCAHGEVAVVGRAGRFPGAASVDELWRRVRAGEELIARLTDEELRAEGVPEEQLADPRYVRAAGVLDGADRFDAAFFGFTPREAELMDPQHRVFLECAWEALEDAGYDPRRYRGRIGVYAGIGINAYLHHSGIHRLRELAERYQAFISNDKDFAPTRASYKLGLTGPSVVVQTACSSSLVAVHLACQALAAGDCDMALAGGVSIRVPQRAGYLHEPGGIGSPDGCCRPFAADAAGTVFGSGAGLVLLKPLAEAQADGDTVHAVVRGTAINNDGGLKVGYTAPSVDGQARVIADALAAAGVGPESVGYVEAHGTGTTLGDPIEVAALAQVWSRAGRGARCALGSVKSNVGHLDTAAGICGLIKTVEALAHRELPPSLHGETPSPKLGLASGPFYVSSRLAPWPAGGGPRRAGVSSFGIGGTNAHVVLEEAPEAAPTPDPLGMDSADAPARPAALLLLSARTPAALDAACGRLAEHLRAHPEIGLADAARTLQVGRRAFAHRRALVVPDHEAAIAALATLDPDRVRDGRAGETPPGVAFLFPGQGAQHPRMGEGLYRAEPLFRRELDRCAELLAGPLGLDLRRVLYPEREEAGGEALLAETRLAQPALFAVEHSLARLWMSWGVEPEALLGHSIGELAAACIAGVMTLPEALALVAARGRLMQGLPGGAMLGVELGEAELAARLAPELSLAAVNGPAAAVASGPEGAIAELARRLEGEGIRHRRLHTSHAFHSAMMEPILDAFAAEVARVRLRPPERPLLSSVTGAWMTAEEAVDPAYWTRQLRATVRFGDGAAALAAGGRRLLEVGPGGALAGLARRGTGAAATASMRHPRESIGDSEALLGAAGRLWLAGVEIDWERFAAPGRRVPLPTYPFERRRYWLAVAPEAATEPPAAATKQADLAAWSYAPAWRELPPRISVERGAEAASWLFFLPPRGAAGGDLCRRLAARLGGRGEVATVELAEGAGEGFRRLGERAYALSPGGLGELFRELAGSGCLPRSIVHAWNLDAPDAPGAERAAWPARLASAQALAFDGLVELAQALERARPGAPLDLTVLASGLWQVAGRPAAADLRPERALLLGPVRVLPQEHPGWRCRAIDLLPPADEEDEEALLAALAGEPAAAPGEGEPRSRLLALRGGSLFERGFAPLPLAPAAEPAPSPRVRPGGAYVVTGGFGGIGLTLARELARQAPVKLALLGRRLPAAGDGAAAAIAEIAAAGSEVLPLAADVADRDALAAALRQAEEQLGPLRGVLHAAGVAGGGIVQWKTPAAARRVMAPKLQGTVALDELLGNRGLDFFVVCSSITAVAGGFGQSDYCAANAFCDAYVQAIARRDARRGRLSVAVGWDRWEEVGMAARAARGSGGAAPEHPLLGRCIAAGAERAVFRSMLDAASSWVLAEHRVAGVPTVPGTTYLEMARAALAFLSGGDDGWRRSELRDVVFLAPLAVPLGKAREVSTVLAARGEGAWTFRVASRPVGADADAAWLEHARGEIVATAEAAAPLVDLVEPAADEGGREIDLASLGEDDLLRTGPRWHSLRRLVVAGGRGAATLELAPELAAELSTYLLHPALLDLAAGAVRLGREGSFLPLAYQRLRLLAPFPPASRSLFRLREGSGEADVLTADVVVVDPRGGRVVEIEGFTMRRLSDAAVAQLHAGKEAAAPLSMPPAERSLADAAASAAGTRAGTAAGILPAEGAEIFRRILRLDGALHAPHLVISTAPLAAALAAADALDRDALAAAPPAAGTAAAAQARPALATVYAAPGDDLERRVAEAWQQVLGIAGIGVHDNFFELGGSSLSAIQLVSELRRRLGVEMPSVAIFEAPTIHRLVAYLRPLQDGPSLAERERGRADRKRAALAAQQQVAVARMPREGRSRWRTAP